MEFEDFKPYSKDWIKQGDFEIRPSDDGASLEVPSCLYKKLDEVFPLDIEDADDLLKVLRDYRSTIGSLLNWSDKKVDQAVEGLFDSLDIPLDKEFQSDFTIIFHSGE